MSRKLIISSWVAACIAVSVFSGVSAHAAGGDDDTYGSAAAAKSAEADCMAWWRTTPSKLTCLDDVSEWWFNYGGNYVSYNPYIEMNRIMRVELGLDPTYQDTISNLAYYTFSVEVDDIQQGTQTDFSDATLKAFTDFESHNLNTFEFYRSASPIFTLIVAHAQYGTLETKKMYYAQMQRFYERAVAIWAATDKSGMVQHDIDFNDKSLSVTKKTLDRYSPTLAH